MSEKIPDQAIDLFKYELDTQMDRGVSIKSRSFTLTGEVDLNMFHRVDGCLNIFEGQGEEPITIKLCSEGGEIYSALAIIGRIKSSPCKIIIVALGQIMSAATAIFAAADKRISSKYTSFMFHQISIELQDKKLSEVKYELDQSEREDAVFSNILAEETSRDFKYWHDLIASGKNVYLTAAECKEAGLVDKII